MMSATTGAMRTRVIADIDYERAGKQFGYLRVPHSHNDSGWGTVAIPIVVAKNGSGPTLLLTAGTHGDEYEGQIALLDLARTLEPAQVQGRVIIMPAHHFPACMAGTRTSPIDGKDVNRSFPGDPQGSFAQILAHYVTNFLLPQVDAVMDVHSGGRSLDCLPCTMSHILDDKELTDRTWVFAQAFGAPLHIMSREVDGSGTFQSTSESRRLVAMSSELGGGNRVSLRGLAITEKGVRNLLMHLGICEGRPTPAETPTKLMLLPDTDCYHFAPCGGIYRPLHELGTWVKRGDEAGAIYDISDPAKRPAIMTYKRSGLLWATRGQGRIAPGDSSYVVIVPAEG
jgi:N-alpha-acetyl-L-2,4-diaminobutyrate deacetylase